MRTISYLLAFVCVITVLLVASIPTNASSPKIIAISAGTFHCIALGEDGTVWEWGGNCQGALTGVRGDKLPHEFPERVPITNVTSISAGMFNSVVLKDDGTVWTWGAFPSDVIGGDQYAFKIVQIPITNVTAVYAGDAWAFAVKDDGTVWAWGDNLRGVYGNGESQSSGYNKPIGLIVNRLTPVQSQVSDVACIDVKGCFAVSRNGTVWAWGDNVLFSMGNHYVYGRLGDFSGNAVIPTPFELTTVANVTSISSGATHVLVMRNDGTVWGWGSDYYGQLGDGGKTGSMNRTTGLPEIKTSPVKAKLDNVRAISAGSDQSMALKSDGTVWLWGSNPDSDYGVSTPVKAKGLTDIVAISAGGYHYMALKNDGSVWVWGDNQYGQAGVNGQLYQRTPVQIPFDEANTIGSPSSMIIPASVTANQTPVITPASGTMPTPHAANGSVIPAATAPDNGTVSGQPGDGLALQAVGLLLLVGLIAGGIVLYKRK